MILLKFAQEIKGDSKVSEHEGWITIDSFQLGVGRGISISGSGADRDTSMPSFSEVTITKSTDIASADLFFQSICGKSLGDCTVRFIQTANDKLQVYLEVILGEAIVSGYSASSGGERPTESLSLNFTKISYQYNQFSGTEVKEGKPKKWDLATNKVY